MSMDTSARAAQAQGPFEPLPERLAPGAQYWQAQAKDRIWVRLLSTPGRRIEVGIWWNRACGKADVKLVFGLYGDSVELGSLAGNGFDAPAFHRLGFGTFAVNVAVQALQAARPPSTLVHGVLSNTAEADLPLAERLALEANRRAFWRRFGLAVVSRGDPPLDYLRGRVADLRLVSKGLVAGQFPRCVPLGEFVRTRPDGP